MRKFTLLLISLFAYLASFAQEPQITWNDSSLGEDYHMQEISQLLQLGTGYTMQFGVGTQQNGLYPRYYHSESGIRFYNGNTATITGDNIVKIEFTAISTSYVGGMTANVGNVATDGTSIVWTGKANEVVFTNEGSSQCRFSTVKVTYEEANALASMVANPAEGEVTRLGEIQLSFGGASLTANEDANVEWKKNGESYLDGMAFVDESDNTIVYLINADEQTMTQPGTYTVHVPANTIKADGNPIPAFVLSYTIPTPKVDPLEVLKITPTEGEVAELYDFNITFGGLNVMTSGASATLTNDADETVTTGLMAVSGDEKTVSIILSQSVTDYGTYYLNIPGSSITVDGDAIVEPLKFKYTIKDPNAKEYSIDPEEGQVEAMQYFTITFDGYVEVNSDEVPTLTNTTTNTTYTGGMIDLSGNAYIYFGDEITEDGAYVLTIPANAIEVLATGKKYGELTFNYTIGDVTPVDDGLVHLPDGVEAEEWQVSGYLWTYTGSGWAAEELDSTNPDHKFFVAFDGSDVYIQGFCIYEKEAWVKGTVSNGYILLPHYQYMGSQNNNGANYDFYFSGSEDKSPYDVDKDVYLIYNADNATMTCYPGVDPSLVPDMTTQDLYYYITDFKLSKENSTGISDVNTLDGEAVYYDMMGRRVASSAHGLVIKQMRTVDGKVSTQKVVR